MRAPRGFRASGWLAIVLIPALYAAHLRIWHGATPVAAEHSWLNACGAAIAIVESALVFLLYRAVRADALPLRASLAGAAGLSVMIVLSFLAPASGDLYAYVGYAILPHFSDAYRPPPLPFAEPFRAINAQWGLPMTPCVYGPLWLAFDRLELANVSSLAQGVLIVRLTNLALAAALLAALRRGGMPPAFVSALAYCPGFIGATIFGGHNDVVAALLAVVAILCVTGSRLAAAVAFAAAAILVKVTFAAVAFVVFAHERNARTRVAATASTLAVAAAVLALTGGATYVHALREIAGTSASTAPTFVAMHLAATLLAVAAAASAFVARQWYPGFAWSFATLAAGLHNWYLTWGLPYVLGSASRASAVMLVVAWPIIDAGWDHYLLPLTPARVTAALLAVSVAFAWPTMAEGGGSDRRPSRASRPA